VRFSGHTLHNPLPSPYSSNPSNFPRSAGHLCHPPLVLIDLDLDGDDDVVVVETAQEDEQEGAKDHGLAR